MASIHLILILLFTAILANLPDISTATNLPDAIIRPRRRVRTFFIGIDPIKWDYYPVHARNRTLNAGPEGDQCTGASFAPDQLLFVGDGNPINDDGFVPSSVYRKIVFREYIDGSFKKRKKRRRDERHLALLGPLMRVAAGETLIVVVRGLPLDKVTDPEQSSFAFEIDGLFPGDPVDPLVAPGQIVTFRYNVDYRSTPASNAYVDSHMLLYRGTIGSGPDGSAGIYKGLLGGVIVYKSGQLKSNGRPKGVHTELVTILWVGNENTGDEEGDVEVSNLMHGINGRVYCSLPGMDMTEGKLTRWYFGSVGNKVDVHTAHIHGLVGVDAGGAHTDSIRLLPGATATIQLRPDNVGTWLMHCHINHHLHAGMQILVTVRRNSKLRPRPTPPPRERVYYIQAEDVLWDYTPQGKNVCDDIEFGDNELIFTQRRFPIELGDEYGGARGFGIGSKYLKTRYIEYTDGTFTKRVKRDESMAHLGVMGPVLRGRVGEIIKVHFRNKASVSVSMHPHGVLYTKGNEGAPYNDGTSEFLKRDDIVEPEDSFTYVWIVSERAGPGPGERQDTKLWMYHGHRNEITETYAGLFGALVIISRDAAYDDQTLLPSDGTREVFLHMTVMNEGSSYHLEENILRIRGNRKLTATQRDALQENEEFQESNRMHAINGYLYCNGPVIKLRQGRRTRFYFYALGTEVDLHTPLIGKEVLRLDVRSSRGTGSLLPGFFQSAVVRPRHSGLQELRCNVNHHVVAGMRALFFVKEVDSDQPLADISVTHYIAADEVKWDYAPLGKDGCTGEPFGEDELVFTEAGATTPGSRYIKAVYREYTDGTFSRLKGGRKRKFSGVVGPILHFEVGEVVRIVFKNNLSFAANMNFVGLELVQSSVDGAVKPGKRAMYILRVRMEAGPSASDLSAVPYAYYSSVNPIAHTAAGLTGVTAITKEGGLQKRTRLPKGTKAVYPLLMNIFRENQSPLIKRSIREFAGEPELVTQEALDELSVDKVWLKSNAMHSINGYLYGNNAGISVRKGSIVRFYVFGYGSEASLHVPIWKGQVMQRGVRRGNGAGGVQIFPFNAETVDVHFETKGRWSVVCAVADHVLGGMKVCVNVT